MLRLSMLDEGLTPTPPPTDVAVFDPPSCRFLVNSVDDADELWSQNEFILKLLHIHV